MLNKIAAWLGGEHPHHTHANAPQLHGAVHGHQHGAIDPGIAATERGIWAIKWSFVVLLVTALFQVVVVWLSGSVALLADTIHNFSDAATAVPLWIAFAVARWKPSKRFTYGYGRVGDLAGLSIVIIIALSLDPASASTLQPVSPAHRLSSVVSVVNAIIWQPAHRPATPQ